MRYADTAMTFLALTFCDDGSSSATGEAWFKFCSIGAVGPLTTAVYSARSLRSHAQERCVAARSLSLGQKTGGKVSVNRDTRTCAIR